MKQLLTLLDAGIEPETIRSVYPHLTEEQFNFVEAIITIKSTDAPFMDMNVFENTVLALNFKVPDFNVMTPPTPEELWHGIKIMNFISKEQKFSPEVHLYAKAVFSEDGIYFMPEEMISDTVLNIIKEKADLGPFPIADEETMDIQTAKYMALDLYHNTEKGRNLEFLNQD